MEIDGLYLLSSNKPFTQKALSLIELFKKGVKVPATIIAQADINVGDILPVIDIIGADYYYVRVNFPDKKYPHHLSAGSFKKRLVDDLQKMCSEADNLGKLQYDIIIQPILNFQWSGAALIRDKLILVEIVFGHPISLLRFGDYKFRFLFDENYNILDINEGVQCNYMKWVETKLITSNNMIRSVSLEKIITELKKIRKNENLLYEFGYSYPDFYYLEFKKINPDSFSGLEGQMIQKPFVVFEKETESLVNKKIFHEASLENINNISFDDSVVIEQGAVLSHLSTFCAENNIRCSFIE